MTFWQDIRKHWVGYLISGITGGALACLCSLAVILFYELSRTGSAADWIVSLASAAMAVTAVFAFVVARSWLPQLTTQEGYKEAIRLVNDQYIKLGPDNLLGQSAEIAMVGFRAQNERSPGHKFAAYIKAVDEFAVHLQAADANLQEIRETRFRLNTYGLTVQQNYASSIADMTTAFEHALQSAWWLLQLLVADASRHNDARLHAMRCNKLNWPKLHLDVKKAENAAGMERQYQNLTGYLNDMDASYNTVFSQHPPVGKLFSARK